MRIHSVLSLLVFDEYDAHRRIRRNRPQVPIICVCISEEENEILCGCDDGFIRTFQLSKRAQNTAPIWEVASAHRGITAWQRAGS